MLKRTLRSHAQASLEFMMTYGWAIFLLLALIVVAWQWGLFNLTSNVKPGSLGFWGVEPEDFIVYSNGDIVISLKTTVGAKVEVWQVRIKGGDTEYTLDLSSSPVILEPGAPRRVVILESDSSFPSLQPGSNFNLNVYIDYRDSRTNEAFRSSGRIWGRVEPGSYT